MLRVSGQMAEARGKLAPDEATTLLQNIPPKEERRKRFRGPRVGGGLTGHAPSFPLRFQIPAWLVDSLL